MRCYQERLASSEANPGPQQLREMPCQAFRALVPASAGARLRLTYSSPPPLAFPP